MSARPGFWSRLGGLVVGADGRLSFSKAVTWVVLGLCGAGRGVPELVGVIALVAAYSPKLLSDFLARGSWSLAATSARSATTSDTRAETRTEVVTRQVQEIHARRDPATGLEVTR